MNEPDLYELADALAREAPRARDCRLSVAEIAAALEVDPQELRAELSWVLEMPGSGVKA